MPTTSAGAQAASAGRERQTRSEHDLLGELEVPADAYYGIHTARALVNFAISGLPIGAWNDLIVALAQVKRAAIEANHSLGLIPDAVHRAVAQACRDVEAGGLHEQFVVDVYQGGAGTSTHMNMNEVVANRALEILGHPRGDYSVVHPLEHVNLGQSTNDVYPTALRLAVIVGLERMSSALAHLRDALQEKADEFGAVVKMGRTQLQDAVPMTLGEEFGSFAVMVEEDIRLVGQTSQLLHEVHLGGTAIGTGLNAHEEYAARVLEELRRISGRPLEKSANFVEATQDAGAFVHVSSVLKRVSVKLSKICHDLRLLSSGPRAGLAEICLPARQAGSSMMPGKVNPVIPELVNQIAFEAIGSDVTVSLAAESGQLQLNAFEPIIAVCLFRTLNNLTAGVDALAGRCVAGIEANIEGCFSGIENSIGLATALSPRLGYELATSVAQEAIQTNTAVRDVVLRRGLATPAEVDALTPATPLLDEPP